LKSMLIELSAERSLTVIFMMDLCAIWGI
jgi:hypothetical protein